MGIIINADTKAIVQGITGKQGSYHTKLMLDYGTKIVAGVVPGKGGTLVNGVPVYDTVKETVDAYSPNASIIFVPAPFAQDAVLEAIANKIKTIVVVTEHLPIKDTINVMAYANQSTSHHYWSKHTWNNNAWAMQTWNNASPHLQARQHRRGFKKRNFNL